MFGCSDFGLEGPELGIQVSGFGFRVSVFWFQVFGLGSWVSGFGFRKIPVRRGVLLRGKPASPPQHASGRNREREFFIDNLLVRIHWIIVMMRWTGLAP